ncbi:hypothetical protein [Streptomyces sp. Qhu-G9]|uniref:hypothetical protein n=1 Tax=Streptomyces sp. Qhu-G9 TaxID=3452799 RepID=UPI0022ABEC57|nr:hypothetical protein [Streptomyces aurantiacus]
MAVSAGLLAAGLAAPAFAANKAPQTDQLWINPPYEQTLPLGADGGQPQSRTLDIGIYHDNDNFTVTDGKLPLITAPGVRPVADEEGVGLVNGVEKFAGAVSSSPCPHPC